MSEQASTLPPAAIGSAPVARIFILTLILGLATSSLFSWQIGQHNQQTLSAAVAVASEQAADSVVERLNLYSYGLRGARGAVVVAGELGLDRNKFRDYALTRELGVEFRGARAFGFIRRVPRAQESQYELEVRSRGWPDFSVYELAAHSGERYVIEYSEPTETNAAAIGLDIASEVNRREAATAAMRSGQVQLTGPITLVQATGSPLQSFLMLLPIYRSAVTPATADARMAAAFGWSYCALSIREVLDFLPFEHLGLELRVADSTRAGQHDVFFDSFRAASVFAAPLQREVFGRRWQFEIAALPAFVERLNLLQPRLAFVASAFVSLLIAILVAAASLHRQRRWELVSLRASQAAFAETQIRHANATLESQVALRTAELESARDQLLMAAEIAELGIWSWTIADDVLHWNTRMFEIYGIAEQPGYQLRYEHWRSRVHPDDIEAAESSLIEAVKGRANYNIRFRVLLPDGSERVIQPGAKVERDSAGAPIRVIGINRDVTAQLQLENSLRRAKEQADAANRAKTEFLANMSHEIRTPMHAVLGMLQLAQLTGLDARQSDYVSKAQWAANSLLGLLNDLLDFSKIDANKLQIEQQPFALEESLRALTVMLSGSDDVEVIYDIDPKLPRMLVGDSARVLQVLVNLAGNALKFTRKGHVAIRLELLDLAGAKAILRFAVSDTGIGISEAQMQRLFQPFVQAEASTSRRFGGTGLGLVISQRLVELMGGSLQAESTPGIGSRFWFDLPMTLNDATPLCTPAGTACYRVLIADDDALSAEALVRCVTAFGWRAEWVSGGQLAVDSVAAAQQRGEPYDVVVLDWQMPDLDGVAAAQKIRSCGVMPVVIMVTAHGRTLLQRSQNGPAAHFELLGKPVTPSQLGESIQRAVSGAEPPAPAVAIRPQRLVGLRLLVVEDNARNRQDVAEMLAAEGAIVILAEGGLEGVTKACDPEQRIDAVLMEVQMSDIDGIEATRRIRLLRHAGDLPIIAMTADINAADRERCIAAGMDEHLGKPIDLDRLVTVLQRLKSQTLQSVQIR